MYRYMDIDLYIYIYVCVCILVSIKYMEYLAIHSYTWYMGFKIKMWMHIYCVFNTEFDTQYIYKYQLLYIHCINAILWTVDNCKTLQVVSDVLGVRLPLSLGVSCLG